MTNFFKKIKEELIRTINANKLFLIFLLVSFVFGLIIAIINLINLKNIIILKDLKDICLLGFLKNDCSLFGFFLKRFFLSILAIIFVVLICSNKYLSYLLFLLTLYFSYLIVFNMGVVIICFGFFGVIFAIINIFLISVCYLLIIIFSGLYFRCYCGKNYFVNIFSNYQLFLCILAFLLILCLLEMILLPFFSSTFVIII